MTVSEAGNCKPSIVNSIALNVPILDTFEKLDSKFNTSQDDLIDGSYTHKRCKSFPNILESTSDTENLEGSKSLIITPLLNSEQYQIWSKLLQSHENTLNLNIDDEQVIENLLSDNLFDNVIQESENFENFLLNSKFENDNFISSAESIIDKLEKLLVINNNVTSQTIDFQNHSNLLIDQLNKQETLSNDLNTKLEVFQSLDPIVKILNNSKNSKIVLKSNFNKDVLQKLDTCLAFVNDPQNRNYKDINLFKYRFNQCMLRALSLIRNYLITYLKNLNSKILENLHSQSKPTDDSDAPNTSNVDKSLIYEALINNMFSQDNTIYNLFVEIYIRFNVNDESTLKNSDDINNKSISTNINNKNNNNDDFFNLLYDIYNQYFKIRENLLNNYIIQPYMNNIDFNNKLIDLSNNSINFFIKILNKEFDIFKNLFFLTPNECNSDVDNSANYSALNKFLENLLDPLYYLLRNKILRESNINSLCELITLIESFNKDGNDGRDENIKFFFEFKLNFYELFQPVLQDAQTRLIFQIQKNVEINIVNYKSTGKELLLTNKSSNSNMIYPPILYAIQLLTKIYQLINKSIFDDILNSIIHLCVLSLKENFKNNYSIDSKLYQIKSLITLKNFLNEFEFDYYLTKDTKIDFSGLSSLYSKFIRSDSNVSNNLDKNDLKLKSNKHDNLFNTILGTIPTVHEDFTDNRIELQIEIRNLVHEFIEIISKTFTEILNIEDEENITPDKIKQINSKFIETIENRLSGIKLAIESFIKSFKIITFLIDGIQEDINLKYKLFCESINKLEKPELSNSLLKLEDINDIWITKVKEILKSYEESSDTNPDLNLNLLDIQKDLEDVDNDDVDDAGDVKNDGNGDDTGLHK